MASCKKCFHYEVCMDYTTLKHSDLAQNFDKADVLCEHFKHVDDVVEVVRCKDCEHYDNETMWCAYLGYHEETLGFCYYGERKQ